MGKRWGDGGGGGRMGVKDKWQLKSIKHAGEAGIFKISKAIKPHSISSGFL
jgi:hypothetical protein